MRGAFNIGILRCLSRVYGIIIRDKIENEYKGYEEEEQCGFKAGRSCTAVSYTHLDVYKRQAQQPG